MFNYRKYLSILCLLCTIIMLCSCDSKSKKQEETDALTDFQPDEVIQEALTNVSAKQLENKFKGSYQDFAFADSLGGDVQIFKYISDDAIYFAFGESPENINDVRIIYHNLNNGILSNESEMNRLIGTIIEMIYGEAPRYSLTEEEWDIVFVIHDVVILASVFGEEYGMLSDDIENMICFGESFKCNGCEIAVNVIDERLIISATKKL